MTIKCIRPLLHIHRLLQMHLGLLPLQYPTCLQRLTLLQNIDMTPRVYRVRRAIQSSTTTTERAKDTIFRGIL